jgi:hypothetical protein
MGGIYEVCSSAGHRSLIKIGSGIKKFNSGRGYEGEGEEIA